MNSFKTYLKTSILFKLILFWIGVFLYFILATDLENYSGYKELIECSLFFVFFQIVTAYICLSYLVPTFFDKGRTSLFVLSIIMLMIIIFLLYTLYKVYYYDAKYHLESISYSNELFKTYFFKFSNFLSRSIKFLTPTFLLLAFQYSKNQQNFLKLNEQKKIAELNALKNQLNPHFLFNTLNNLYALVVKKSDKSPEIIERLASMLDYMIYRCNDKFIFIKKEIELIHNYIALEELRYGNRVKLTFEKAINRDLKIAPLLFITFIENAFKHGVAQELKKAIITIHLSQNDEVILFSIYNTKPNNSVKNKINSKAVGLINVKKQLDLLYPKTHSLTINETDKDYTVKLTLKQY